MTATKRKKKTPKTAIEAAVAKKKARRPRRKPKYDEEQKQFGCKLPASVKAFVSAAIVELGYVWNAKKPGTKKSVKHPHLSQFFADWKAGRITVTRTVATPTVSKREDSRPRIPWTYEVETFCESYLGRDEGDPICGKDFRTKDEWDKLTRGQQEEIFHEYVKDWAEARIEPTFVIPEGI